MLVTTVIFVLEQPKNTFVSKFDLKRILWLFQYENSSSNMYVYDCYY